MLPRFTNASARDSGIDLQDVRFIVLDHFPFRLVYAVEDSAIRIIAVAHQKRRPDYWRGHVEEPRPEYAILQRAA